MQIKLLCVEILWWNKETGSNVLKGMCEGSYRLASGDLLANWRAKCVAWLTHLIGGGVLWSRC